MKRGVQIRFCGDVRKGSLEALKELIYLHPHQPRDEAGILRALKAYGHPTIHEVAEELRIHVGDHVPQSLFAYDDAFDPAIPVGVVIFSRLDTETIHIIHIAVDPDYAMRGGQSDFGLGACLIQEVMRISARISGVKNVLLLYRKKVLLKV